MSLGSNLNAGARGRMSIGDAMARLVRGGLPVMSSRLLLVMLVQTSSVPTDGPAG